VTQSLDRSGDVGSVASQDGQVTEPCTLLSHQKPIDDFPRDQWQEHRRFGRGIQQPDEPHTGVQQVRIQRADIDGPHIGMVWRQGVRGVTGFKHDRADESGGEFQTQTEVGSFL